MSIPVVPCLICHSPFSINP
ncbi:hypothetical protein MTR67_038505 [Solanum verrucosum]|uniref:Uncharacterized protein n=1 Tax=Solanum verrucosum TaxID=315347 RepID=A0AAF0UG36_SOLVR|nr:hypothetical protein MTR67_038505 [Solanum verrucosum]